MRITLFFISFFFIIVQTVSAQWTQKEKQYFKESLAQVDLSIYREYKDDWVYCYLNKLETEYSSIQEAESDFDGLMMHGEQCKLEILIENSNNTIGNWSALEKSFFLNDVQSADNLEYFGDLKSTWIECFLIKAESKYRSYIEADQDEEGVIELATACVSEVFANGSVRGKWSKQDKTNFLNAMVSIPELDDLNEYKELFIDCYLQKCEESFSSLFEADMNEEITIQLAQDCMESIID